MIRINTGFFPELHDETVQAKIFYDKIEFYHDHALVVSYRRRYGKTRSLWTGRSTSDAVQKPGAAEHTRSFRNAAVLAELSVADQRSGETKAPCSLDDIVRDGNAEFCGIFSLSPSRTAEAMWDSEAVPYSAERRKNAEPLDLLSQVLTLNYNPDISCG